MLRKALELRVQINHTAEINIFPFKFKYFNDLLELHRTQKYASIDTIKMRTLPKIGYIAYFGDHPVAAGFLRRLEPCYAQIDTLVSNAYFGSAIRHEGVKLVVDALITEAKRLKLEGLICHTSDVGVLKRATELGFNLIDQKIIALPLKP